MCMAKVIQLAKDLLKGGHKEDIYPKTLDTAVFLTDNDNNPTSNTLKEFFTERLSEILPLSIYLSNDGSIYSGGTVEDIFDKFSHPSSIELKIYLTGRHDYHLNLEESYELNGVKHMIFGCFIVNNNTLYHLQAAIAENESSFTITNTPIS